MRNLRLPILTALLAGLALLPAASPALSGPAAPFPDTISLPNGFRPEGVAIRGQTFYVGSIGRGSVYRGSLRTGQGTELVPPHAGRASIGVAVDARWRLFVAGGPTGHAFVYDGRTGADIADYTLTTLPTFINDVVVTPNAVWFTDSFNQQLYKLPLGPGGSLPTQAQVQTVPLTGAISYVAGQFNANGIDATPDGRTLVIVQSVTGFVFTVDASTGVTKRIDLGAGLVTNGDGILLDGKRLYVVENFDNLISVWRLSADLGSGTFVRNITAPMRFDIPTTIDEHGNRLYAVNARFSTPPTSTTPYTLVKIRKH